MLETGQPRQGLHKPGRNIVAILNLRHLLPQFPLENGTFNFRTRIGYVKKKLTFNYYSHNYPLGEAG